MPRSRRVPVDARPELTDEIVMLGFLPYDADKEDVRDMIVEVLEALDVPFVDKTTCKRAPVVDDGRWAPITSEYFQNIMADSNALMRVALVKTGKG